MIEFQHSGRLWLLLIVVAVLVFYLILSLRLQGGRRPKTRLDLVLPRDSPLKRHLSVSASLLSMSALVLAFATPLALVDQPRERATIIVTMDVSLSMRAEDVAPTRLDAAKTAAQQFVDALPPSFNVALVTFSGTATMISPPTLDRGAVKNAINSLELAPATAVGEGIYTSLDALALAPTDPDNPDEVAPGAIVLLSDGYTNVGRDSATAATTSGEQGVPIYTIAYGTAGGYVWEEGVRVPVPVNHNELSVVAKNSGGKKYAAESLSDLNDVYSALARDIGYEKVKTEITDRFALGALVCAVLAGAGVISLAARWP